MVARAVLVNTGLFFLGIVLLAVGILIEPLRTAANPVSEAGESLIALGLTSVLVSIGYFLAWANPAA